MTQKFSGSHSSGPERLTFTSGVIHNLSSDWRDDHDVPRINVEFTAMPGSDLIRESVTEEGVRARLSSGGGRNLDAEYWMAKYDTAQLQLREEAERTATAEREYEASKHLWKKRYDEQGPELTWPQPWDDGWP